MPFIPNELDAFHASQSSPDSGHFDALRDGSKATGVVSGCAVTAQGTPDMTVAVATGVIAVAGARANVTAGNVTITTAHGTNPRIDLIVVSNAGAKSAVAGTPAPEMVPGVRGPAWPAIPANSVLLASVYVPAADTTIAQNQIGDHRVFVLPPEPTTNYDLAKARSIPLVKERSQTVTLDTGQNLIHGSAMANGKLFFTTRTNPAYFIRVNNLEDLTDRTLFQFAADGLHDSANACVYVAETDRLYVLFNHASRVQVTEVNPSTHATVDVINDTGNIAGTAAGGPSICSDGVHLYVSTVTSPAKILKYRLSDFTLVGTVTLTKNNAHSILYDGTDVFASGQQSPSWIARIDPVAMTAVEQDLPTGANLATDDMASVGDYIWLGIEITNDVNVFRIEKANLANQLRVYSADEIWAVYYDGQYVYAGKSTEFLCIDPVTLDVATLTMPVNTNEILSDGTGRLFGTTFESPSKVFRVYHPLPIKRRFALVPDLPVGGSIDTVKPMGKRFIDSTTRATSGTSEGTLGQMSVSGNQLNVDGMMMRITVSGTFAANANTKRIAIRLGSGNYMFDTGLLAFNDVRWKFVCEVTRTGAATQDWSAFFISDSSVMATDVQNGTAAADLSALQFLAVRGQSPSAAGEVVQEQMWVEVIS